MCYGDADYGRDGFYQDYLDHWEQSRRAEEEGIGEHLPAGFIEEHGLKDPSGGEG